MTVPAPDPSSEHLRRYAVLPQRKQLQLLVLGARDRKMSVYPKLHHPARLALPYPYGMGEDVYYEAVLVLVITVPQQRTDRRAPTPLPMPPRTMPTEATPHVRRRSACYEAPVTVVPVRRSRYTVAQSTAGGAVGAQQARLPDPSRAVGRPQHRCYATYSMARARVIGAAIRAVRRRAGLTGACPVTGTVAWGTCSSCPTSR